MILFGVSWWTKERPLWNFIKKVSTDLPYGELLRLSEDEDEIINDILSYNPDNYEFPKSVQK